MARYQVTVVSGDPSRTAAEVAADAGAEVIRKMSVAEASHKVVQEARTSGWRA